MTDRPSRPLATPLLDRKLARIARRLAIARALDRGSRLALAAAPIGLAPGLVRALVPGSPLADWDALPLVLAGLSPGLVCFFASSARTVLEPHPRIHVALWAEGRASLGAPLSTALELDAAHAWSPLVAAEAEHAAASLEPARLAPISLPRALPLALALMAASVGLLALPPRAEPAAVQAPAEAPARPGPETLDALSRASTKIRLAASSLPHGEPRRRLESAGARLQDLLSQLEAGKVDQREALAQLTQADDALRLEREAENSRRTARRALERSPALEPLSSAAQGHGVPDERASRRVASTLVRDAATRDAARRALDEAKDALAADPSLAEPLDRAARSLDSAKLHDAPPPELAPALDAAARALASTPTPERDEHTRTELARASSDLDHAREALGAPPRREPGTQPPGSVAVAPSAPPQLALASPAPQRKGLESQPKADESRVKGDESRLKGDKSQLKGDESQLKGDESQLKGDESRLKGDESRLKGDESRLKGDESRLKGDESRLKGDKSQLKGDESRLKGDESRLKGDESQTTGSDTKSPDSRSDEPKDKNAADLPLEAAAELAKLIPPDMLAQALKLGAKLKDLAPDMGSSEPPKIDPEKAEKLLESLPPETLAKLAKAMSELAKDLPPPPANGSKPPPLSPETAERLARKLPPDVLESLSKAARDAGAREGKTGGDDIAGNDGPRRLESGAGASGGALSAREGSGEGAGPESRSGSSSSGSGSGTGAGPGAPGSTREGPSGGAGNPSPPAATGFAARDKASPTTAPSGTSTSTSAETPTSGTGTSSPKTGPGGTTVESAPVATRARVSWATAPESLPASERELLRAALERQRVPDAYERAVRQYFDLKNEPR